MNTYIFLGLAGGPVRQMYARVFLQFTSMFITEKIINLEKCMYSLTNQNTVDKCRYPIKKNNRLWLRIGYVKRIFFGVRCTERKVYIFFDQYKSIYQKPSFGINIFLLFLERQSITTNM